LQSCYVSRAYRNRNFRLTDLDKLESLPLLPSEKPFEFAYKLNRQKAFSAFLDSNLYNTNTYSFLVIKNDSIVYEKYFDDVTETTKLPSFSVAKSFVGTLVQMAIEDGYIKSLQEPITNYLGFLKENDNRFENITIQHVMNMASGIKNSEDYSNPFGDVLHLGFTKNLNNQLKKLKIETTPGNFDYKSVNTQLLAAIIEVSTQQKVQDYFVKKIWYPLGMQYEATWNIDSKKHQLVRAFCCINAATKDFAKLGKLYLQKGNYNGKQLISEQYITNSTNSDSMQQNGGYKNQWWAGTPFVYFKDSLAAINFISITPKLSLCAWAIIGKIKDIIVN
jgi:CubicO group peptidase (beta-lactamase class C family)